MSETLRWGLVGTARINRRLIPAMRAARRSVVTAVASREAARGESYAHEWAIPVVHVGYDSLLRDPSIDAVYIPLPNSLHVEWTLRALDAGKHVLCEKPLALTADDVDRVEAVARARERVVAEAFMYRHEPLIARALELVTEGRIGDLRTISCGYTFLLTRDGDVRLDPALGGGSLWDVGCYAVSATRFIARAEPVEVSGFAQIGAAGVDGSFAGVLRFPGDILATVQSGLRSSFRMWLEIGGADASLHVPNPFRPASRDALEIRRGDDIERVPVEGSPLLFVREVEDFVGAALDGRPPAVSLRESRGNAATLAALHQSAKTGRPVQL